MTETTRLRMWMKYTICTIALLLIGCRISAETLNSPAAFTISDAKRFAGLALACVHKEKSGVDESKDWRDESLLPRVREYPNKLLLQSEQRRGCSSAAKAHTRVLWLL
jgi:hypothetical protein